jgi:hypothetical protein
MSSLASFFRDTNRRAVERFAGRIEQIPGHWEVAEPTTPAVKEHLDQENRHYEIIDELAHIYVIWSKNFKGQYMRLVKGPATHCHNPEMFSSWAEIKPGIASVKMTACRKCPFYRKATRQYHYPTCAQRADPNPKRAAAQEFVADFNQAVSDVNKMMKG